MNPNKKTQDTDIYIAIHQVNYEIINIDNKVILIEISEKSKTT